MFTHTYKIDKTTQPCNQNVREFIFDLLFFFFINSLEIHFRIQNIWKDYRPTDFDNILHLKEAKNGQENIFDFNY